MGAIILAGGRSRRGTRRQPETGVSEVIRGWLELHGWRVFRHNAIRVTGAPDEEGRVRIVKGDPRDKGLGDLLCFRYPHVMVVESKRPGGRLSKEQREVHADPRVGPLCVVASSLEALWEGMARVGVPTGR